MNKLKKHNQIIAAAKAGMNVKTAHKYIIYIMENKKGY
jgi:hypothetical protein